MKLNLITPYLSWTFVSLKVIRYRSRPDLRSDPVRSGDPAFFDWSGPVRFGKPILPDHRISILNLKYRKFTKIFMKTIIWSLRHILLLTYRIKYVFTGSNVPLHDQMCRYRIKYMVTDAITISKTKMVAQVIQWSGVIGEFKKLADPVRLWSGPVRQTGSISVIRSGPVRFQKTRSGRLLAQ